MTMFWILLALLIGGSLGFLLCSVFLVSDKAERNPQRLAEWQPRESDRPFWR